MLKKIWAVFMTVCIAASVVAFSVTSIESENSKTTSISLCILEAEKVDT